ncbi:MAG: type VI secretion system baseplate subunit TssG [Burkholderiales bacterium]|nr:type VI secretion system baseplate subunit TssG [Burkholderiales bacterium]
MAAEHRGESRHLALLQALAADPHRFDFYRALREIECAFADKPRIGEARRPQDEPIRFCQAPSLAFAPSTLAGFIPAREGRPPRLIESFFGLLGPNGPLPLHLTEFARDRLRNAADPTFVRFLDLFHHRLIALFYRAWARAQPTVSLDRPDRDRFALYVGAFIGLTARSMRARDAVPDAAKLSFAGLLGRQVRNADGLVSILRGYLRVPVAIQQLVAHWMDLPQVLRTRLGREDVARLGETAVAGARVWDLQSRFRLVVGPLCYRDYERFLPGGPSYARLSDWVRTYVGFELKWDCRLVLKADEVPPLLLGYNGRLGWTSWLGTRLGEGHADDLVLAGH